MELQTLALGQNPPKQILSVSHYHNTLVVCCFENFRRSFNFYKIIHDTRYKVVLDRQVTTQVSKLLLPRMAPKLFVYHNLELNKTIMVLIYSNNNKGFKIEIFDYETVDFITKTKFNGLPQPAKCHFCLWKQHYLIADNLSILELKQSENSKEVFAEWNRGLTCNQVANRQIFNIGDKLLLLLKINYMSPSQETEKLFYRWNEETKQFEQTQIAFNSDMYSVSQRSRTEGVLLSVFCIHNQIVTIVQKSSAGRFPDQNSEMYPKRAFVWSLEGEAKNEIPVTGTSFFVWNGALVDQGGM